MKTVVVSPLPGPENSQTGFVKNGERTAENDEEKRRNQGDVYDVMRPLFWALRASGLYYLDGKDGAWSTKAILSCIYCVGVQIAILAHVCRMFLVIPTLNSLDQFVAQGVTILWCFYVFLLGLMYLSCCARTLRWREFFSTYDDLQRNPWIPKVENLKKKCKIYVFISVMAIAMNIGFTTYLIFWTQAMDIMAIPFKPTDSGYIYMKIVSMVIQNYCSAICVISLTHPVILTDVIGCHFDAYSEDLKKYSEQCPVRFSKIFTELKELYESMHELTESANSMLGGLMGSHIIFNLALTCLVLYVLLYNPYQMFTVIFYVAYSFFLLVFSMVLFIALAYGAWLHERAHGVFDVLQAIKIRHVTEEFSLQMSLFASKLCGSEIGITAAHMFILNKDAFLSVVGMLITYFFLLIQFRPSSDPVCDCTSALANLTTNSTS